MDKTQCIELGGKFSTSRNKDRAFGAQDSRKSDQREHKLSQFQELSQNSSQIVFFRPRSSLMLPLPLLSTGLGAFNNWSIDVSVKLRLGIDQKH
jgi:hypothetical protein